MRSPYLGSVIVLILGVHLGAWALTVATRGSGRVPVSGPAVNSQSLVAGSASTLSMDSYTEMQSEIDMATSTDYGNSEEGPVNIEEY